MKTCVILNPWAGRGQAGQRRAELERALREAGVVYDLLTTFSHGGATELAYQAIERGYDMLVAVGGDGTINEVVNGIAGSRERLERSASLAIIPMGTGSDFVKVLDTLRPDDLPGGAALIARGQARPVDLGHITVESGRQTITRYFINGLGMGIDAQVAVESAKLTRLKGFAVYLVAVIRALTIYRPTMMHVRYDTREVRRRMLLTTVANGRCQGGGFWMTPEALIDDGILDLCMVEKMRLDEIIRYIPRMMEGTHTALRQATMGRACHVEVECANPIPVATDGEVVATDARRITVNVVPGGIMLVA